MKQPTRRLTRTLVAAATTTLVLTGAAACGSDSSQDSSSSSSSSGSTKSSTSPEPSSSPSADAGSASSSPKEVTATISIKDFAYKASGTVKAGAKVMVKNDDSEAHTVTADGAGGFDVSIPPGKTATFTAPSKAGSYKYHCTFHSNMHGTLAVG